jgi:hypothetical protein
MRGDVAAHHGSNVAGSTAQVKKGSSLVAFPNRKAGIHLSSKRS